METENLFISERELEEVIAYVRDHYQTDFTGYARSSLSRRVARFKKNFRLQDFDDIKEMLASDENMIRLFVHEISVNTTEMFRDPEFWLFLRQHVLPQLQDYSAVRIWHAGCSTGEEVYSMLILLHEANLLSRAKIFATDISNDVLGRTRQGAFRQKDFEAYCRAYVQAGGEQDFASYFDFIDEQFSAKEFLKAPLHLKMHNLSSQAPFSKFDLILCRNVMIYFSSALQSDVVTLFAGSLFKGGFLCIGKKENIGFLPAAAAFNVFNQEERIYTLRS